MGEGEEQIMKVFLSAVFRRTQIKKRGIDRMIPSIPRDIFIRILCI